MCIFDMFYLAYFHHCDVTTAIFKSGWHAIKYFHTFVLYVSNEIIT